MRILNFGSCNIDYVYSVDSIVYPGQTISSKDLNVFAGGKGLNQSLAVARSGQKIYHAGCIGKDGSFLKEILKESGVNTKYLKQVDGFTGNAIIQVDKNGENSILLYNGANHLITREYVDYVLEGFEKGDVIILQNEISNLEYIVDRAYERGLKIVLNPSPISQEILGLDLSKIYLLILNQLEGLEISKGNSVDDICNFFANNYKDLRVVLTLGKRGSIYILGKEKIVCKAFDSQAVDTTGAGDTFLGYFVSNFTKNGEILTCLKIASMAAAIAVSRKGAAQSIPLKAEVISALEQIK